MKYIFKDRYLRRIFKVLALNFLNNLELNIYFLCSDSSILDKEAYRKLNIKKQIFIKYKSRIFYFLNLLYLYKKHYDYKDLIKNLTLSFNKKSLKIIHNFLIFKSILNTCKYLNVSNNTGYVVLNKLKSSSNLNTRMFFYNVILDVMKNMGSVRGSNFKGVKNE